MISKQHFNYRTVSIVIPFFNEEKTIGTILSNVYKQKGLGWKKEIILINDGSTDNSLEEIKLISTKNNNIQVDILNHSQNLGMGKALKEGIARAKGEVILFQDADCEYDPKDIPALLKPFDNQKVQIVYGSRYKKQSKKGYYHYYLATRLFTWLINKLYGSNLTDAFTGYKIFRSSVIKNIYSPYSDFAFNVDITTKVLRQKITIYEVPIAYTPRSFSEGKKISPWIGVKDLLIIIKNKFL